jgi:alkanesulfonate monooxygenase SsuD/methylene tetrahydromethanopterin reductase-like flavin-dependent oxidoreductase (luciferase family)
VTFDVGVQVFPGAPAAAVDEARLYESLGADSVWVADHFHGAGRDSGWAVPELFTTLGAIAARTSRVRLGSCVASTTKRQPAQIAHAALTLSALSDDRFELGLGTGFGPDLSAFGVPTTAAVSRLEESLDVIFGLFRASADEPLRHAGERWRLEDAFLCVPGGSPPRVLLAAIGPRMLAITAARAGGWLPFGMTPALFGEFRERMEPLPDGFAARIWIPTFVERPGEDRSAEAEATGRLYLSMAPQVLEAALGHRAPVAGRESSLTWTPERGRDVAETVPRDLALAVTLHGSPQRCAEQVLEFAAHGCTGVVLRMTDTARRSEDAERLLPALTAAIGGAHLRIRY